MPAVVALYLAAAGGESPAVSKLSLVNYNKRNHEENYCSSSVICICLRFCFSFCCGDKNSIGVSYGLDYNGVLGIQGEFGIASKANGQPLSVAVYYKNSSQTFFGVNADISALGFTVNYDLTKALKITNDKFQPYAGVGFERVSETVVYSQAMLSSAFRPRLATASSIDLSYTVGAKYSVSREVAVSASFSSFEGIAIGAHYYF